MGFTGVVYSIVFRVSSRIFAWLKELSVKWPKPRSDCNLSCVYRRVLTRVQLTSGREPSSNPPMDVG